MLINRPLIDHRTLLSNSAEGAKMYVFMLLYLLSCVIMKDMVPLHSHGVRPPFTRQWSTFTSIKV
jgi:hypothetical protein